MFVCSTVFDIRALKGTKSNWFPKFYKTLHLIGCHKIFRTLYLSLIQINVLTLGTLNNLSKGVNLLFINFYFKTVTFIDVIVPIYFTDIGIYQKMADIENKNPETIEQKEMEKEKEIIETKLDKLTVDENISEKVGT